ncbi:MAG: hypothetical protein SPH47_01415 [Collinsella sp.]|nr:hypothetical protein [Collinsella sp.]
MAFEIVDGMTGTKHISSDDLSALNIATIGESNCVLNYGDNFKLTMTNANTATLGTGVGMVGGKRFWNQAATSLTVQSGTQGQKRNDLVVARYAKTSSGIESITQVVIKGTPTTGTAADPDVTANDLKLWRVPLDGISVGEPVKLFEPVASLATIGDSVSLKTVYQGNVNIYGSVIGVRVLYNKAAALLHVMTARVDGYMNTGTPGYHEFVVGTIDREFRPISDRTACLMADVKNGLSEGVTVNADGTITLTVWFSVAMVGYSWGEPCAAIPLL